MAGRDIRLPITLITILFMGVSITLGQIYTDVLSDRQYAYYEGEWTSMPDLDQLPPKKSGSLESFDVSPKERDQGYAFRYTAILTIPVDGNYLILQKSRDTCLVYLDGEMLFMNDGLNGRRPRIVEHPVKLKAGRYQLQADYLSRKQGRPFELTVGGPYIYRIDQHQWLYIGWENDHPKSLTFMGGSLSPGRGDIIQYAVEVDNVQYVPDEYAPDRRAKIDWSLAENYLPCPVSKWDAGKVKVEIRHFANRVLEDQATAVFSRVSLTNTSDSQRTVRLEVNSAPDREIPITEEPTYSDAYGMYYDVTIPAGATKVLDFVTKANGNVSADELRSAGSFDDNFMAMAHYYNNRINNLTRPLTLPDQQLVDFYRASQIVMWESVVKVDNGDVEMRGSGGNLAGYYQYDRTFSHDVPNMVDQFIREGDYDLAKSIMESGYYQELGMELEQSYLDAIPKYIIPYAKYLQITGDKAYFTPEIKDRIKAAAHLIHKHRDFDAPPGHVGIMKQSNTLDNGADYLIVDNFAALHGLAAYRYFCQSIGDVEEAKWAEDEMIDLNNAFNAALDSAMERRGVDWYMSAIDDDSYFWKRGYDGNWIGTSLMMSTFPWDASLQGFDLGGTWKDHFDNTMANSIQLRNVSDYNIPERSWGAWWGHEYGTGYNAGMGLQLLISDKLRTEVIGNLEFLMENQSAPFQWGESFDRGLSENDWTRPAADYETWGLSYDKQALLESNISVHANGSVIIGRGIPEHWLKRGDVIEWRDIRMNANRKMDFKIVVEKRYINLELSGDDPLGDIIFDLPLFVDNISKLTVDGEKSNMYDNRTGVVQVPPITSKIRVKLKKSRK